MKNRHVFGKRTDYFILLASIMILVFMLFGFIPEETNNKVITKQRTEIEKLQTKLSKQRLKLEKVKEKTEKLKQKRFTELLELTKKLQPKIDTFYAKKIVSTVLKYSKEYNIPSKLIICIIARESSFDPFSVSSANCVGLMQINPRAHKDLIKKHNLKHNELFHIENNIMLGCVIFSKYYNRYNNIHETLTRYVGGQHDNYVMDILSWYTESNFTS